MEVCPLPPRSRLPHTGPRPRDAFHLPDACRRRAFLTDCTVGLGEHGMESRAQTLARSQGAMGARRKDARSGGRAMRARRMVASWSVEVAR